MKLAGVAVGVVVTLLLCSQAFAFPVQGDGFLADWGIKNWPTPGSLGAGLRDNHGYLTQITPPEAEWKPTNLPEIAYYQENTTSGYHSADDFITADRNGIDSGGEWYDVETLFVDLDIQGSYVKGLSWAVLTSWNGYDPARGYAWQGLGTDGKPYHAMPYIAIDLDGNVSSDRYSGWDYGLVLADDDSTADGRAQYNLSKTGSESDGRYSDSQILGSWDHSGIQHHGNYYDASLYSLPDTLTWRGAMPGVSAGSGPVDFDRNGAGVTLIKEETDQYYGEAWEGARPTGYDGVSGGNPYTEAGNSNTARYGWPVAYGYGWQNLNFVWEGSMTLAEEDWITLPQAYIPRASYGMFCCNDYGDQIGYGGETPVPEPCSMAFLALAGVGIAGTLRRRRHST